MLLYTFGVHRIGDDMAGRNAWAGDVYIPHFAITKF